MPISKTLDYDGIIIEQDAGSFGRSTKTFIALEKVKATEVSKQGNTQKGVTQDSLSAAKISIAGLFRKINPNDEKFTKYIPKQFFGGNTYEKNNLEVRKSKDDTIYLSAVERGDMETAQRMVAEAERALLLRIRS